MPRLRQNRASAIFWKSWPKTGTLSLIGSTISRTRSVCLMRLQTMSADDREDHDRDDRDLEEVGQAHEDLGRSRQRAAEVGEQVREGRHDEQQHADGQQDGHDEDDDRVGHRGLDLAAQARPRPRSCRRSACRTLSRKPPTSPALIMLTMSGGKMSGCLAIEHRERRPASTSAADLGEDLGERLVRLLLLEDRQRAQHRQAGVDHRGELPAEDGELLELDLGAELGERDLHGHAAGLDLGDLDRGVAHALELGRDRGRRVGLDLAGDDLARAVADRVLEGRGGCHVFSLLAQARPASRLKSSMWWHFSRPASYVIRRVRTRSARCWSSVCMPCWRTRLHDRVDLVGLALADEVADRRRHDEHLGGDRRGRDRRRSWPGSGRRRPGGPSRAATRTCCCWCGGKTSMMRSIVWAASWVCRVAKTR